MIPILLVFSIYLLVVGHDAPGGGFAGGLAAAAAVLLIYLAYGHRGLRKALHVDPEVITGIGLTTAFAAGALGLVIGEQFLAALSASFTVPAIGVVKLTSVLVFDAGVYLVVVGLVATGILRLGEEEPS